MALSFSCYYFIAAKSTYSMKLTILVALKGTQAACSTFVNCYVTVPTICPQNFKKIH